MKKLPVSYNVMSSTYQYIAYEFAILEAHPAVREHLLSYFHLKCEPKFLFSHTPDLEFAVRVDTFDGNPHFNTLRLSKDYLYIAGNAIDFIIEAVDNGRYVYLFDYVDEFYIPKKRAYNEYHNTHDILIYGYNVEEGAFYTLAYDDGGSFGELPVSFGDFRNAIVDTSENRYMSLVQVRPDNRASFTPQWFNGLGRQYVSSVNPNIYACGVHHPVMTDTGIYGIRVYEYLVVYLTDVMCGRIEVLDQRIFRQLWEQKKILNAAVQRIGRDVAIPPAYMKQMEALYDESDVLRNIALKYGVTGDAALMNKMIDHIRKIAEGEREAMSNILNCIV